MSVAVKTRRTLSVKFKKNTPTRILRDVRSRYAQYIDDADELVDYIETDQHASISESMTPGQKLRELRTVTGKTLQAVGDSIGVSAQRVHEYETGQRGISKDKAKKLGALFGYPADEFI